MSQAETAQILQEIARFYPGKINLERKTVQAWYRLLKTQTYEDVIDRLDRYAAENKYSPLVHDLVEKPRPERNKDVIEIISLWEANASGGPVQP
ncbi:hypothetical protein CR203_22765 [Salipaludibacillus neizhouensis]|uniref:Uncharacterized protein n=1 Tax=Salipaludibacillus neizhouensis TaxID=885475 RepID=A0A3A9K3G8_9BACI|nr:replicative helicase loader/inhibitor [Salipaludibacillus neizhouensis]RKL65022.1 hypothetical protein CR203_22765 [Salipaludibacillus neizhouensis]